MRHGKYGASNMGEMVPETFLGLGVDGNNGLNTL